ncbi:DUF1285 domain-containing protein [Congregibacter sp.]|uniref:DUF1285 domain-containing protein n=1 Tax=Congregibacter sp. TaxID=2744308 RepID=UPI003F6A9FDE
MDNSLQNVVDTIVAATPGLPDPHALARWSPALSGDIDIRILADGSWTHDGDLIHREGLVRVFASLLRRENDGHYYLVTPAEKWRIQVERHALVGVDCEFVDDVLWVLLNTGGRCQLGGPNRLHVPGEEDQECAKSGEPFIEVPNGLTAQITRAAWYRLIDAAQVEGDTAYVISAGEKISLGAIG